MKPVAGEIMMLLFINAASVTRNCSNEEDTTSVPEPEREALNVICGSGTPDDGFVADQP